MYSVDPNHAKKEGVPQLRKILKMVMKPTLSL
ncbi:hypothetical protein SMU97_09837 [Streptococcus mutans SM4]|nr:hypothetical protein SMU97_09837 [Streptococcus mutans SM4]